MVVVFLIVVLKGETAAIEMLGALKNVVALAAGFCDGMQCGGNTKVGSFALLLKFFKKQCRLPL